MEQKVKWKERINYVKEVTKDGKVAYTGASVNYGSCCSSWESVEDLQRKSLLMIKNWLEFAQDEIQTVDDLEMKECTPEEWEAKDDNVDYWEIERMKRILNRPTVREKFKKIILDTMATKTWLIGLDIIAEKTIDAMINCEN